ncbi:MAG: ribosomal RNA small subunit methyltransferase A [Euryarchaeota archaeon]|nr:ribosomal RNA small subunit methyltransferase A [Euryarchaeota archaeon]
MPIRRKDGTIRPKLGQHFLKDPRVAARHVGYASVGPGDAVLEIGPGPGILTFALAEAAKHVYAVEIDRELADRLEAKGLPANVEVIRGDALKVTLPRVDKVVANLPYKISSAITFRLLKHGFKIAALMYQKEFADRLVGKPGTDDYSRLSVNVAYRADCKVMETVPPGAFDPPPRVHSAIVTLSPRPAPFKVIDDDLFEDVVRLAFGSRRKTLRNALLGRSESLGFTKTRLAEIIPASAEYERRGEVLTPAEFAAVANRIAQGRAG